MMAKVFNKVLLSEELIKVETIWFATELMMLNAYLSVAEG